MPDIPKATKGSASPGEDSVGSLDTLAEESLGQGDTAAQLAGAEDTVTAPLADELAATAASDVSDGATEPSNASGILSAVSRGHYEIQNELARGGMGRIVRARDKRLGRSVAIKELLRDSRVGRARFEREALITARLQHPAIVPLYEAGQWPDGEPFFAMKMVAGKPLDEVVRERKDLDARLALLPRVIDVADALAYAHSEGVIHRDLKPANVLIGDFGETVVIDWGLAKRLGVDNDESREALQKEDEGDAGLTVMGQAMGTPAYMPPEQARGEEVDKRADVYSLGAMLYHVLAGKMAYADSKSVQEVLSKVLKGPPASLSTVAAGIPDDLLTVVNKAMDRDPERRYPDAAEFAEELRRFEAGNLVAAHRYSFASLLRRWLRKHRSSVAIATLLMSCLAAFAVWSFAELRGERDQAEQAREQAMVEKSAAEAKSQELALNMAASRSLDDPLAALQELALMQLDEDPIAVERAREVAAQARSNRIARELTAAGNDHGAVALSPDKRRLAIAWHNQQIALVDLESGARQILPGSPLDRPGSLVFSADGSMLVCADASRTAYLWQLGQGSPPDPPSTVAISRDIKQVLFSPDQRWLAIRTHSHVEIIDRELGLQSERQVVRLFRSNDMSFSPDSQSLAVAGDFALIRRLHSGEEIEVMPGRPNDDIVSKRESFLKILYSPDGRHLAFADNRVLLLDVESGRLETAFKASGEVTALAFSADSTTLAVGSTDTIVYLYRLNSLAEKLHTLTGHDQGISWLAFAEGSHRLASAGLKGQLRLWTLGWFNKGSILFTKISETLSNDLDTRLPAISKDGQQILAYDRAKVLRLWQRDRPDLRILGSDAWGSRSTFAIAEEKMFWSGGGNDFNVYLATPDGESKILGSHGEQVELVAISKDGRYAASGGATRLILWNLHSGEATTLEGHESNLRHIAFTEQGLISADFRHGHIFRWNLQTGTGERIVISQDLLHMQRVATDPKGRWVVTADRSEVLVHLLDGEEAETRHLATSDYPLAGMAVSEDGQFIAMSLRKGEIQVLSPLNQREAKVLLSSDSMESLWHPVFSPDGKALAATNRVTGIRLWPNWHNSSANLLLRSKNESSFPSFSPDGQRIVAAGKPEGSVAVWQLATRQRRDMQSYEKTSMAKFWPSAQSIVVSSWGGMLHLWSDDLPKTWPDLKAWIHGVIKEHALPTSLK